jgi:hypothetical protein
MALLVSILKTKKIISARAYEVMYENGDQSGSRTKLGEEMSK